MKTPSTWLQAMQHDVNHRNADHGFATVGQGLVVLAESTILAEPAEGSLNDPPSRQEDESLLLDGPLDDIEDPVAELRRPIDEGAGVASIGPNPLQTREPAFQLPQHELRPVTILNLGAVHDHGQQQSERIDDYMTLAARDFLARVIAMRPPFCGAAVLTDWLSSTAADGEDSRSASTRTFSRRAS